MFGNKDSDSGTPQPAPRPAVEASAFASLRREWVGERASDICKRSDRVVRYANAILRALAERFAFRTVKRSAKNSLQELALSLAF